MNFLTGRYVATAHHDRGQAEWPPHPARLFSAMVATHADCDQPDRAERAGLEWLEAQASPSIHASDAVPRSVATHFVPVNDARVVSRGPYLTRDRRITVLMAEIEEALTSGTSEKLRTLESGLKQQRDVTAMVSTVGNTPLKSAVDIMPPGWLSTSDHVRTGQARMYPSVTPIEPRVTFIWDSDPGSAMVGALDRFVCPGHQTRPLLVNGFLPGGCKVSGPESCTRRGRSRSPIRSVGTASRTRTRIHEARRKQTAVVTVYSCSILCCDAFVSRGSGSETGYIREWLVFSFRKGSNRYPSTMAVELAAALRGAVFRHARDPMPEGLSGHREAGQPSTDPHVGFLSLPWVGYDYADGRLMGVAVALPERLELESRRALLRSVGSWERVDSPLVLTLGRRGRVEMDRIRGLSPQVSLRSGIWSQPSRRWVSATPIALPTHPGRLGSGSTESRRKAWNRAEQAVRDSCQHVGLPDPVDVAVSLAPLMTGARPAPAFPAFRQSGRDGRPIARRLVHAALSFERPIVGPLVLGSGRYLGLGLMRPMSERRSEDE